MAIARGLTGDTVDAERSTTPPALKREIPLYILYYKLINKLLWNSLLVLGIL